MSTLAPLLESFFTECLVGQRAASPHTIAAYRDTFRLLLRFTHDRVGTAPARLDLAQLDAPLIGAFLTHLEVDRHNRPSTRNARLGAIHSFFTYVALRCPEHAGLIQRVLALPYKRTDRALVSFLTPRSSPPSSPAPTSDAGSAGGTTPCSPSWPRPACVSRRSSPCGLAMSTSAPEPTCTAGARAARTASRR